jgi:hypothetical protein
MPTITTGISEFQVVITEERQAEQSQKPWHAVVSQMPHLAVEGESRADVIAAIKNLLARSVRHAEVVTVSLSNGGQENDLSDKGYRHYGIFANDPEALKLFDEIEEERNKNLVDPVQP